MTETVDEIITFGYIPWLGPGPGTLMPNSGGMAGVEYAIVCTHHIVKARKDGGYGPVKDAEPFIISGPKGEAECVLLCRGEPMRGVSSLGGAQECEIDVEIYELTGFPDPDEETVDGETEPSGSEVDAGQGESSQGDVGIQIRQPSV